MSTVVTILAHRGGGSGSGSINHVVASEAEMLALIANIGDTAFNTTTGISYLLTTLPPTNINSWRVTSPVNIHTDLVSELPGAINKWFTDPRALTAVGKTNNVVGFDLVGGTKTLTLEENCTIDQNLAKSSNAIFNSVTSPLIDLAGTGTFTFTSGINWFAGNIHYTSGFDNKGSSAGFVRHNIDIQSPVHGTVWSAGNTLGSLVDLFAIQTNGKVIIGDKQTPGVSNLDIKEDILIAPMSPPLAPTSLAIGNKIFVSNADNNIYQHKFSELAKRILTTDDLIAGGGNTNHTVISQVEMLALTAIVGDTAYDSSIKTFHQLTALPASTLGNWLVKTTDLIPELVNLYFTNTRALTAIQKTNLTDGFSILGGNTSPRTLSLSGGGLTINNDCTIDQNLETTANVSYNSVSADTYLEVKETLTAPPTNTSAMRLYTLNDGILYAKDKLGTSHNLFNQVGGTGNKNHKVTNQAGMLALMALIGDTAYVTDETRSYLLQALPPTTLGNWLLVNIHNETTDDISEALNLYFTTPRALTAVEKDNSPPNGFTLSGGDNNSKVLELAASLTVIADCVIDQNLASSVIVRHLGMTLAHTTTPATPVTGVTLLSKTNNVLYTKDSTGLERRVIQSTSVNFDDVVLRRGYFDDSVSLGNIGGLGNFKGIYYTSSDINFRAGFDSRDYGAGVKNTIRQNAGLANSTNAFMVTFGTITNPSPDKVVLAVYGDDKVGLSVSDPEANLDIKEDLRLRQTSTTISNPTDGVKNYVNSDGQPQTLYPAGDSSSSDSGSGNVVFAPDSATPFTLDRTHRHVICDAVTNVIVLNLSQAVMKNKVVTVKKRAGGLVVAIIPTSGLIGGLINLQMVTTGDTVTLISDGTDTHIIGRQTIT